MGCVLGVFFVCFFRRGADGLTGREIRAICKIAGSYSFSSSFSDDSGLVARKSSYPSIMFFAIDDDPEAVFTGSDGLLGDLPFGIIAKGLPTIEKFLGLFWVRFRFSI